MPLPTGRWLKRKQGFSFSVQPGAAMNLNQALAESLRTQLEALGQEIVQGLAPDGFRYVSVDGYGDSASAAPNYRPAT